jgi:hypothetical protein
LDDFGLDRVRHSFDDERLVIDGQVPSIVVPQLRAMIAARGGADVSLSRTEVFE